MQLHDLGICMQCAWGIYHNIGVNAKILRLSGRLVENVQLYIYIYIYIYSSISSIYETMLLYVQIGHRHTCTWLHKS